jgi:hypothetical protein
MQNAGEQTQARLNIWPPQLLHEIAFMNSSSKTVRKPRSTFLTMAEALSALTTALHSLVVSGRKWATPVHLEFAATLSPVVVPLGRSTRPSDEARVPCQRDVDNSFSFLSTPNENRARPVGEVKQLIQSATKDTSTSRPLQGLL